MKTDIFFSAIVTGVVLLSAGNCIAEEPKGSESITLQGGSMGSITFPHHIHQAIFIDCKPCHDLFPQESKIVERLKTEGKLKKKEVMDMCRACHKDLAGKGQKTGPIACMDCHKK